MRESSNSLFSQNSQETKVLRGGEKKVMKKGLSILTAATVAFSVMSSAAFAAEVPAKPSVEDQYKALVAAGIFEGDENGNANLDKAMNRAQAAKIVALLTGYEEGTEVEDAGYKDLTGYGWAKDYINYATEVGVLEGKGGAKFDPGADVTIQQLAKIAVEVLEAWNIEVPAGEEVEGDVDAWAAEYVASAVSAGLLEEQDDYTIEALRGLLVVAAYEAVQAIEAADELKVTSVKQTGAKKITVTFNKEVSAEAKKDLTFALKYSSVDYKTTATYAADNKSVVLEAAFLPAAEYTVTVKGYEPVAVTVADEKVSKLDIAAVAVSKAANQDLKVKAFNQFNEEISNVALNLSVYNATKGASITPAGNVIDASGTDLNDNIIVTATHASTGTTVSKTFKVVSGSAATVVQLSAVQPLEGKSRISINESGLVLPYNLADQNGQKILLPETPATNLTNGSVTIGGITFIVSNPSAIDTFAVDSKGVLTFKTLAASGTVTITAINNVNGQSGFTTVKVEAAAKVKTFQMSHPGVLVAAGEDVKIPFVAADTYGAAIAGTDLVLSQINLVSSNGAVTFTKALNNKGELVVKFTGSGVTTLFAYIDGALASQVQIDVKATATPVKIVGIENVLTTFTKNAEVGFNVGNIKYVDNYGRSKNVAANSYTVESSNDLIVSDATAGKLIGGTTTGTATIKVSLNGVTGSDYTFNVSNVATSDVKSFEINDIGTLYGKDSNGFVAPKVTSYVKTVSLTGKLANGTKVAIVQDDFLDFVTTSDATIVLADGAKIAAIKAGEVTVSAWKNGKVVATAKATAADAAPVAKTVEFGASSYTVGNTASVTVKDQYGVAVAAPVGYFYSEDASVVAVNLTTGALTAGTKNGEVIITYVTANGVTATTTATN
ncbi:S-layer homology domain-containing protein [Paenibacillus sp. GCM10023252]|uniref:S-layer homology domain-containing protein n=1 Tax=Paenibacillus sp. GCM10023252 TaxID=3252649 RepID=UPI00361AA181